MRKPTDRVWWIPGGETKVQKKPGYGHVQSLPPPMYKKEECIAFVPEVWYDNIVKESTELLTALKTLIHLHTCEQEGLSSGKPTPKQWFNTVNECQDIIDKSKITNSMVKIK